MREQQLTTHALSRTNRRSDSTTRNSTIRPCEVDDGVFTLVPNVEGGDAQSGRRGQVSPRG